MTITREIVEETFNINLTQVHTCTHTCAHTQELSFLIAETETTERYRTDSQGKLPTTAENGIHGGHASHPLLEL